MSKTEFKSERAAKLALAKILRRHEAKQEEIWAEIQKNRENGYCVGAIDREFAFRDEKSAIYAEMLALRDACKARGWYVTNSLIRYNESSTAELVRSNID